MEFLLLCLLFSSTALAVQLSKGRHLAQKTHVYNSGKEFIGDPALLQTGVSKASEIDPGSIVDPLFSISGYIPDGTPFTNPSALSAPTPIIPSQPDCAVRPQTIVEIQRMRAQSFRIAQLIDQEVPIMSKRKAYVEQMTAYLNDRIRELNMVKEQLADELKWIEVSQNKIEELQQREKLAKLQDILSCLNQDTQYLEGDKASKAATINSLQTQQQNILAKIDKIKSAIANPGYGATGGGNKTKPAAGADTTTTTAAPSSTPAATDTPAS